MTLTARAALLAASAGLFVVVATANSGGYRYGASDQAFYQPAIATAANPSLFPRDRPVLDAQMRLWPGDSVIGAGGRLTGGDWPLLFIVFYVVTLLALFAAGVALARALGASWWTTAAFVALLTLRHRIAKTGANTLEGYMHPRMLAFAFGLAACAAMLRARWTLAGAILLLTAVLHPTTAVWFGGVWVVAIAVSRGQGRVIGLLALVGTAIALAVAWTPLGHGLTRMDAQWLAVIGEKDYLFSSEWPLYAWVANLSYPILLVTIYRARQRAGVTAAGEQGVVLGLLTLVAVFLVSVPASAARIALAVQLQVNRVFWVLDAVAILYVAWWIVEGVGRRRPSWRVIAVSTLSAIAVARGVYVNAFEARRPLFEVRLPDTPWVDAMTWIGAQPAALHVLADPAHAWKYGPSVRVAAVKDVLLEASKDAALSMYDRSVAMRTAERQQALSGFDEMTVSDVRALATRFDLDVFVDTTSRSLDLPQLYRNSRFVVYDLR